VTVARQLATSPSNGVTADGSPDAPGGNGAVGGNTLRNRLLDILYEEQEQVYQRISHPF
jgi:hypothetical protein